MKRTFISCLLLSLIFIPLNSKSEHAYLSEDFKETLVNLHHMPNYEWSPEFHHLCKMIKEGKVAVPCEEAKKVVEECRCAIKCAAVLSDKAAHVERYYHALHRGDAVVAHDELNNEVVTRRKKCKTFNRLIVRCLLNVLGNATFAGDVAIAGNEALEGNLAVGGSVAINGNLSVAGNEAIAGTLTVGGVTLNGSLLGFGAAIQAASATGSTVAGAGANVVFTPGTFPAVATVPSAAGITVINGGNYAYYYQVRGTSTAALDFVLQANGVNVAGSEFASDVQAAIVSPDTYAVNGYGLATFAAGQLITLHNNGAAVTSSLIGAANNVTLVLLRVS
jgi:hypothetical protein